jgi:hypothetical protein
MVIFRSGMPMMDRLNQYAENVFRDTFGFRVTPADGLHVNPKHVYSLFNISGA